MLNCMAVGAMVPVVLWYYRKVPYGVCKPFVSFIVLGIVLFVYHEGCLLYE